MPQSTEAKTGSRRPAVIVATLKRLYWGSIVGSLLTATTGIILITLKFGLGLVHLSYDLPFAIAPSIQPAEAVMVYMDDESYKNLGQNQNAPWDRALHARLLDRLTAAGVKAVAFDIIFSDPGSNPESDAAFAKAIRANGKVVLGADVVVTGYGRQAEGIAMNSLVVPYDPFKEAAAALGTAEVRPDDDLFIRHPTPMLKDDVLSTLSWSTAALVGAEVTKQESNRTGERWMHYYGPPTTIPNVSYDRALIAEGTDRLPDATFSNKVVFVGARMPTKFAGERKDEFPTPHSRWAKDFPFMPGVEIQATACLNLVRGDWLRRLPQAVETVVLAILGLVVGFALARLGAWAATGLALALTILASVLAYLSFTHLLIWFPWLLIVAQIFVALIWSIVFNSIQLYVQNKLYEASLALYLSPKLVKKFSNDKTLLKPGAKKETLTILFSDIASFTSISEGMDSDQLAKDMNTYFEVAVSQCVHHTDGTIVKYIGDAIFAFWNAPDPQNDHQFRACEAALRFRDQPPQYMNGQQLITRIGLHTGVANVGNFGSRARVDYTALGENINLASRMESFNKYMGTEVLLTGETQAGVEGRVVTRFLGSFRLKGFERNVEVHELVGLPEKAEASRPLREAFAAAVKRFKQRDFDGAKQAFEQILKTAPNDGPTKFYLKHLADLKTHPVPDDWEGEIELKEK